MASNWIDKGGYLSFPRFSAKLRYRTLPLMPLAKFVRSQEDVIGAKRGDTVNITRIYDANTPYPTTPLSETAPIPVTDWNQDQVTTKVYEWGQAFDLTEKFARLSDFDPDDITTRLLQDSIAKWQNNLISNKLKQTGIKYTPITGGVVTGCTSHGTGFATTDMPLSSASWGYGIETDTTGITSGTTRALGIGDLMNFRALATKYRIPNLTGEMNQYGDYAFVCDQSTMNTLMLDTSIAAALNYAYSSNKDGSPFMKGFMGTFYGIQFFIDTQNMLPGEFLFFGDDAVAKAEPLEPEIRRKSPLDYGRDKGVAWYGLSGFKFMGGTTVAQAEAYLSRCIHGVTAVTPAALYSAPTEIAA